MIRPRPFPSFCAVLLLAATIIAAGQRKKYEEPKSEVQPLPPEPPAALEVETDSLDFHISPLLRTGGLAVQIRRSLNDLIRDTHGETIIKLRAFVAGSGDARRVQALVTDLFTEHKLPLPVLTILQVGALGDQAAQVVIEAVVSTHRGVNPNGLGFFFAQRGRNFEAAVERLRTSTEAARVDPAHVLSTTCFTAGIDDLQQSTAFIHTRFSQAQVNLVQAVRDPGNEGAMCEAVAQLSAPPPQGPVVLMDSIHATLVHTEQLVLTGLQLTFGQFLDDGEVAFSRLKKTASAFQAAETPVEVNAFALDPRAGALLRRTMSLAPGTLSVQDIEGLQAIDATAGIEAIMAPGVASAVVIRNTGDTITR